VANTASSGQRSRFWCPTPRPQDPRQREARELPLRAFDLLALDAPVIDKEEVPDGN
jgi:hypothetical protein